MLSPRGLGADPSPRPPGLDTGRLGLRGGEDSSGCSPQQNPNARANVCLPQASSPRPSVGPQTPREEGLRGGRGNMQSHLSTREGRAQGERLRLRRTLWGRRETVRRRVKGASREETGCTGQLLLRDKPPPKARGFANSHRSRRATLRSGPGSASQPSCASCRARVCTCGHLPSARWPVSQVAISQVAVS